MSKGMNKTKQDPQCCIVCGERAKLSTRIMRHEKRHDICGYIMVCNEHAEITKDLTLQRRHKPEEDKIIVPEKKKFIKGILGKKKI